MSDNTLTLTTAKAAVVLLEEAIDQGLPLPSTAEAGADEILTLAFDHLDHIRAWSEWLDLTVHHDTGRYIRHTFAGVRYGVSVRGVCSVITRPEVGV